MIADIHDKYDKLDEKHKMKIRKIVSTGALTASSLLILGPIPTTIGLFLYSQYK
jgi:hypothetical protein